MHKISEEEIPLVENPQESSTNTDEDYLKELQFTGVTFVEKIAE